MKALLDTGPWVALIDRSEVAHEACVQWFASFSGELFSTEAVLTEVLYLLNFSLKAQQAALDFVIRGIVTLVPSDLYSLHFARTQMEKYADLPMDFADATLVCLAEESGILNIASLDHKDFSIYRTTGNQVFRILTQ
ncbi:PilT protein domain protein [Desulfonatronospira thiodismutans ASO3-1]|uniref:Ribonuclease VapC n=1 Tax=Desulfonatronospira thiodismutans ASO3-1 TaxID=555779 RepID=D6SKJ9_9BACT|nr:PIN domain-containing protein [Desulfonatronospira thiodismutans]EFI35210.1 PilT protein domain protein [Desulfonatronospira thiodismutans ASO3-1]